MSFSESHYKDQDTTDLDEELKASGDKIRQIAESLALSDDPHYNPHRKSGGGFEDYLDDKTLARLEELKILPGNTSNGGGSNLNFTAADKLHTSASYGNHHQYNQHHHHRSSSLNSRQPIDEYDGTENVGRDGGGTSSGPDYLEISKKVRFLFLLSVVY